MEPPTIKINAEIRKIAKVLSFIRIFYANITLFLHITKNAVNSHQQHLKPFNLPNYST